MKQWAWAAWKRREVYNSLHLLLSAFPKGILINLYSWKYHFLGQCCMLLLPESPSYFRRKWQPWCGDVPDQHELLSALRSDSSYLEVTNLWYSVTDAVDLIGRSWKTQCLNLLTIHALGFNVIPTSISDVKYLWCKEKIVFSLGHYGKYLSRKGQHLHL